MPKVIKRVVYGESKWKCPKCKAIHWIKFDRCQNSKCKSSPLERVK